MAALSAFSEVNNQPVYPDVDRIGYLDKQHRNIEFQILDHALVSFSSHVTTHR